MANYNDTPGELDLGGKATLDESDIGFQSAPPPSVSRAQQKVELDLDDAPFLEEEEIEEQVEAFAEAETAVLPLVEDVPEKRTHWRRFRWYYLTVILAVLLAIPIRIYIMPLFFSEEPPPPPTPIPVETPLPPPEPPKPAELTIRMEPFWIEKSDEKGNVRFIHFQFAVTTTAKSLEQEFKHKRLVLRDAVYYYLKNKKFDFLTDTSNIETIKTDIAAVLNQFIGSEQLETIYIEEYLIK